MKRRHKRLVLMTGALAALGVAASLVVSAMRENMVFFFTPTQVFAGEAPDSRRFRIGGLVEQGSVRRQPDGTTVRFSVSDRVRSIPVEYHGVLPDLFKENEGVVAQGRLGRGGLFLADQVLAKHDETYMPPEAAQALLEGARQRGLQSGAGKGQP